MWRRTQRGTIRYNDGEFVHIFALPLASLTNAITPDSVAHIAVSNINWNQTVYDEVAMNQVQELQSLDSLMIRNLNLEVEMYIRGDASMDELSSGLIYTPSMFFVNVMDLRDMNDDLGYPADVTTDTIPNYFGTSYGALDPSAPQASPNNVQRPPFHGATRTVMRRFQLLNAGEGNFTASVAGPQWKTRFTHTVRRPIRLGPKQGLVVGIQGYNTVDNEDMVLVAAVHARFGYHRFKRDMHA